MARFPCVVLREEFQGWERREDIGVIVWEIVGDGVEHVLFPLG